MSTGASSGSCWEAGRSSVSSATQPPSGLQGQVQAAGPVRVGSPDTCDASQPAASTRLKLPGQGPKNARRCPLTCAAALGRTATVSSQPTPSKAITAWETSLPGKHQNKNKPASHVQQLSVVQHVRLAAEPGRENGLLRTEAGKQQQQQLGVGCRQACRRGALD